jgi:hypothetical protein
MAVPQQYLSSLSVGTFDWSTWIQGSMLELEPSIVDTNQVAWANWEGFVDDLYGPGDLMQGQEYGLPAIPNPLFPQP